MVILKQQCRQETLTCSSNIDMIPNDKKVLYRYSRKNTFKNVILKKSCKSDETEDNYVDEFLDYFFS